MRFDLLLILFLLHLFSFKIKAQDIPAIFDKDSTYYRCGAMYPVDSLPPILYQKAARKGVSREKLQWMLSDKGQDDSVRVFADIKDIRVSQVAHTIINKTSVDRNEPGRRHSGTTALECMEDGAMLFQLKFDVLFDHREPRTCRYLGLVIQNFDPSFTYLEFRNVNARITNEDPPPIRPRPRTPRPVRAIVTKIPPDKAKTYPHWKRNFYFEFCIKGEIHGERILPDGSYRTGKLYDFRMSYERSDGYIRGYIKPHAVE